MSDTVIDCLGRPCPIPIIELARAIRDAAVGDVVTVLSDDPAAGPDIQAWCRMRGHSYEGGGLSSYQVKRLS